MLIGIAGHFYDEEIILKEIEYPYPEEHRKGHKDLVEKATVLVEKFKYDQLTLGEFLNFIVYDIVSQHMLLEDRKYFPYIEVK